MSQTTHTDTPFHTFAEETVDALAGLEGYLLMLGTADGTVKLATSGDVAVGVLAKKNPGNPHVQVTPLGSGLKIRGVAGGVIPKGSRVVWGTGGKFVVQPGTTGTYRTFGRKLNQGSSAANDVIEIESALETITV